MSDDPRDALLAVAREIIAKRGYVGLSVRTASAAAGVTEDVARRYYRNRDSLFAAAMRLPVDPVSAIPALMAPGIEGMGERLVRFTLDTLRDPEARDDLMSLARTGVSAGQAVTGLQEFIEIGVVDRVAGMIGVPDARMRSALITSYLLGVATMRYGVRLEPLASASDEEVIRMVAPVIQDLLDPRRPIPGSARARARSAARHADAARGPAAGPRTRTFDPDPAATRAAEAGAPGRAGGPDRPPEAAAHRGAARAHPHAGTRPSLPGRCRLRRSTPAPAQPGRRREGRRRGGARHESRSPDATSTAEEGRGEVDCEEGRGRRPPRRRPPWPRSTAKKAAAKKATAKKPTPGRPSAAADGITTEEAAAPVGPKHAQASPRTGNRLGPVGPVAPSRSQPTQRGPTRSGPEPSRGPQRPSNSRATAIVVAWSTRPSCQATVDGLDGVLDVVHADALLAQGRGALGHLLAALGQVRADVDQEDGADPPGVLPGHQLVGLRVALPDVADEDERVRAGCPRAGPGSWRACAPGRRA